MSSATGSPLASLRPERIAVVRALQLGDLLCAVPALRAFRAAFPDAQITLVGIAWARAFTDRFHHLVDGFLELPGWPGLPETDARLAEIPRFLARAHEGSFDLGVQLHGSGQVTNVLTVLLGARRNAGFYVPGEFRPDAELFIPYPAEGHEVRRLLMLPAALGLPLHGERLEFPLRADDEEELRALDGAADLARGEYACVHPGARFDFRRWPPERFAAVADVLVERGLRVVLTGSAAEAELTQRVAGLMAAPALDLTGRTSLGALAALLDGARVLVSNDTGVSHLAAALRVPSVVVVTTSDPDRWAPLDRLLHRVVVRPGGAEAVVGEIADLLERERARVA